MAFENKLMLMAMAVLAVALAITSLTEAQSNIPSCAAKLVPCYSFIHNTTKPDNTCCSSIKEAVAKELPCLCTLYTTPGLLATFNVSVDDALRISRDCNVPTDLSSCNISGGAPSPTSVPPPPGTPGSNNGASAKVAWTGITSLLLFWASMMLLY